MGFCLLAVAAICVADDALTIEAGRDGVTVTKGSLVLRADRINLTTSDDVTTIEATNVHADDQKKWTATANRATVTIENGAVSFVAEGAVILKLAGVSPEMAIDIVGEAQLDGVTIKTEGPLRASFDRGTRLNLLELDKFSRTEIGGALSYSPDPKLEVTVATDNGTMRVGDSKMFTVEIINNHTTADRNVRLTMEMPSGLELKRFTADSVDLSVSQPRSGVCEFGPFDLRPEAKQTFRFQFQSTKNGDHELVLRINSQLSSEPIVVKKVTRVK